MFAIFWGRWLGLVALAIILGCLASLGVWMLAIVRRRPNWNQLRPPISDDEFVSRCSSGVSRATALRVRRVVAEQLGVPYSQVYPEQHFVNDLFCD